MLNLILKNYKKTNKLTTMQNEITLNGKVYLLTEKVVEETYKTIYDINTTFYLEHMGKEEPMPGLDELEMLYKTAKVLNGDWVASGLNAIFLYINTDSEICLEFTGKPYYDMGRVLFKDTDTAHKAIDILGEDVVRKALQFGSK